MFFKEDLHIIKEEIISAIKDLELNLKDKIILTEAASGLFMLTPILALEAGAKKVFAVSKDSIYGKFADIREQTIQLCRYFGYETDRIEIIEKSQFTNYNEIDIVTNLGHVRPINEDFICKLNRKAVISYMCEAWEHRQSDLDLELCSKYNIPVFATNENHPLVNCFRETGLIAVQMILDSHISIIDSKILILSRDNFGKEILKQLSLFSKKVTLFSDWSNIKEINLSSLDIIITADYLFQDTIIGKGALIEPSLIKKEAPNVKIIQFCGKNEMDEILKNNISIYPKIELPPQKMFKTLADISYKSFIRLYVSGLKAADIGNNANKKFEDLFTLL